MAGPGALTLAGSNAYTGGTTLLGGVLSIASFGSNLPNPSSPYSSADQFNLTGGTLLCTGAGADSSNADIYLPNSSAAINVQNPAANVTLVNLGGGSFTKTGSGTLTLPGGGYTNKIWAFRQRATGRGCPGFAEFRLRRRPCRHLGRRRQPRRNAANGQHPRRRPRRRRTNLRRRQQHERDLGLQRHERRAHGVGRLGHGRQQRRLHHQRPDLRLRPHTGTPAAQTLSPARLPTVAGPWPSPSAAAEPLR